MHTGALKLYCHGALRWSPLIQDVKWISPELRVVNVRCVSSLVKVMDLYLQQKIQNNTNHLNNQVLSFFSQEITDNISAIMCKSCWQLLTGDCFISVSPHRRKTCTGTFNRRTWRNLHHGGDKRRKREQKPKYLWKIVFVDMTICSNAHQHHQWETHIYTFIHSSSSPAHIACSAWQSSILKSPS